MESWGIWGKVKRKGWEDLRKKRGELLNMVDPWLLFHEYVFQWEIQCFLEKQTSHQTGIWEWGGGEAKEKWNHLEAADCSFSKWLNAKFNWMCSTRENSLLIKTSILEVPSNLASFLNYNMCKRKTPTIFYLNNTFYL